MIYFIKSSDSVKIGYSRDPAGRLKALQTASPLPLEIIRIMEGGLTTEAWLHEHFSSKRLRGEWFAFCPTMMTINPPSRLPLGKPITAWSLVGVPRVTLLGPSRAWELPAPLPASMLPLLADDELAQLGYTREQAVTEAGYSEKKAKTWG